VVEVITLVKANLQPAGKPLAAFLFIGPTGVGKTELAKCLASFLFGSPDRLIRFDMSEYQDPAAADRLIRGADRLEGLLTRKIRREPFSVLLLDEIEKAHRAVLDLLLQVLGEARLTDARGKTCFFHNTIVIMTSNLGASHRDTAIGMSAARLPDQTFYEKEIAKALRPELVNRIDRVVAFHPLSLEEAGQVGARAVSHVSSRRGLVETGITLELEGRALSELAVGGYSDRYGARALRRVIEDRLVAPAARLLSRLGPGARGGTVAVSTREDEGLHFALAPGAPPGRREIRGIADLSARRRDVDRWFGFSAVEDVREQVQFLVSQLSYRAQAKKKDVRPAREIERQQGEHHRLAPVYERARSARADVHAIEEMALTALLEGERSVEWIAEMKEAYQKFRHALLHLLVVREKGRDQITLLVQELNGSPFGTWLGPLLSQRKARGWSFTFHIDGDLRGPEDEWPSVEERRFGPGRTAEEMERRLREPRRRFHAALVRVEGPYALLLATEAGLHRFLGETADVKPTHLYVTRLAQRATLGEKDWPHAALKPVSVAELNTLSRAAAHREYDPIRKELKLLDKSRILPLERERYWQDFEDIALEHLLCLEEDDDIDESALEAVFTGPLDSSPASRTS